MVHFQTRNPKEEKQTFDWISLPDKTTHDHVPLRAVTHKTIHTTQVEQVERVIDRHRHIHHIQHHVQPIHETVLVDQATDNPFPETSIQETHPATAKHQAVWDSFDQWRDRQENLPKERSVVDLGERLTADTVTHHIYHVIQPIIQREVIVRTRIRTVIPTHITVNQGPYLLPPDRSSKLTAKRYQSLGGRLDGQATLEDVHAALVRSFDPPPSTPAKARRPVKWI